MNAKELIAAVTADPSLVDEMRRDVAEAARPRVPFVAREGAIFSRLRKCGLIFAEEGLHDPPGPALVGEGDRAPIFVLPDGPDALTFTLRRIATEMGKIKRRLIEEAYLDRHPAQHVVLWQLWPVELWVDGGGIRLKVTEGYSVERMTDGQEAAAAARAGNRHG